MARTPSTMLSLETPLPFFKLKNTEGEIVKSADFAAKKGILVMFICNHCPYVIYVREELVRMTNDFLKKDIAVVAINSNDVKNYPEDSPENMREEKKVFNYQFPYLFDDTQTVAKSFHAACTPDFYLFDGAMRLFYRGQMDPSRPGNGAVTDGCDLRHAVEDLLAKRPSPEEQKPSLGCNIKWKAENES